jgi:hypothetical protein
LAKFTKEKIYLSTVFIVLIAIALALAPLYGPAVLDVSIVEIQNTVIAIRHVVAKQAFIVQYPIVKIFFTKAMFFALDYFPVEFFAAIPVELFALVPVGLVVEKLTRVV